MEFVSGHIEYDDAVIAASGNLSSAVQIDGGKHIGLIMPSAWTAAGITFQVSMDGINYSNLYDDAGAEVAIVAAASTAIALDGALKEALMPWKHLKLRSGTSGTPVAQAAERTITVIAKG